MDEQEEQEAPLHTNIEPYILFLHGGQIQVMIDALVAFANQCEAEGDVCGVAPTCDELHHRLHELREIDSAWVREMMKEMGSGRYRHRPQG
jgi:hypothetical protein